MKRDVIKDKILKLGLCCLGLGVLIPLLSSCEREEVCIPEFRNSYKSAFFRFNEQGNAREAVYFFDKVEEIYSDTVFHLRSVSDNANPYFTTTENIGVRNLRLALNPASDTVVYVFSHRHGTDTLKLRYKRDFNMISPDCGLQVSYKKIAVLQHSFDSVRVVTTTLAEPDRNFDIAVYSRRPCTPVATNRFRLGFFGLNQATGQPEPEMVRFEKVRSTVTDSVFHTDEQGEFSNLALSLNPAANLTTFIFENGEHKDTLRLTYNRRFEITSAYCSLKTHYQDLAVDYSTFGHVQVAQQLLEGREGLDLELFFESPCEEPLENPYRIAFFSRNEQGEGLPETVNFDEVRVLGNSQALYTRTEEGIQGLQLPLNAQADSTSFIFKHNDSADTLTIGYARHQVPTGPANYCEPDVAYSGLQVKHHTFEEVNLLRQELNENRDGFDLEIYQ